MAHRGFVGLGVMGSRMVKRLLDAGHMVVGYNRTRAKAEWLVAAGMHGGGTPPPAAPAAAGPLPMARGPPNGVQPILQAIGPKVTYVGGNGQAVLMKIATNLSPAVQMLAFSEGLLLAEKSGIPRATAVEVLLKSVIASPMLLYRGPFVLEMPEEAWFDGTMMQKDMQLALAMGRKLDVPLPTTAVTNEMLTAARGMGLEKRDFAVLYDVMARLAGGHA